MSPRKPAEAKPPKPPKAPKPWRRDADGTYRSADDRFGLAGDGTGRWFVRDESATDELGLPRTTGPFATLADAKAAADAQRDAGAPQSPLSGRLEAARTRPTQAAGAPTKAAPKPPAKVSEPTAAPLPMTPPKPTWLDELDAHDPAAARQTRTLIRALEARGIRDAGALVRRDRLGGRPVVAERLLMLEVRSRVAAALVDAPGSPSERATTAARVLGAVLEAIGAGEADRHLPTWELVEGKTGRRLRPDASEAPERTSDAPADEDMKP